MIYLVAFGAGFMACLLWLWALVLRKVLGIRWWQVPGELWEAWRG